MEKKKESSPEITDASKSDDNQVSTNGNVTIVQEMLEEHFLWELNRIAAQNGGRLFESLSEVKEVGWLKAYNLAFGKEDEKEDLCDEW